MPRSASTWAYNVVLGLLREAATGEVFSGYDENLQQFLCGVPASASHAVVKCHQLDALGFRIAQLGAAKVIYTWRDLADAIVSQMAMFRGDFEDALGKISTSLDLYHFHRRNGALTLGYRDILADPEFGVRKIAEHLELDASDEQIDAIADATSLASMRAKVEQIASPSYSPNLVRNDWIAYDPETLLHVNHIRNGSHDYGRKMLNDDQLRQIDALLAEKGPLE
jgi:hypothetical protein